MRHKELQQGIKMTVRMRSEFKELNKGPFITFPISLLLASRGI